MELFPLPTYSVISARPSSYQSSSLFTSYFLFLSYSLILPSPLPFFYLYFLIPPPPPLLPFRPLSEASVHILPSPPSSSRGFPLSLPLHRRVGHTTVTQRTARSQRSLGRSGHSYPPPWVFKSPLDPTAAARLLVCIAST